MVTVYGILPDSVLTTQLVFVATIEIDCCASPTIITAPTLPQYAYEYILGMTAIDITLSG